MLSFFKITLLISITSLVCSASVNIIGKCKKPFPMPNLDVNRMQGTWYLLAADKFFFEHGDRCSKMTETLKNDNKTISLREEYIDRNNQTVIYEMDRMIDANRTGVFLAFLDTDVKNILGSVYKQKVLVENHVVFTDYDNIQLRYQCQEVENYWYTDINENYYIMVRNRTFDNWRMIAPLLRHIEMLSDLNDFAPYRNDPMSCKN